MCSERIGDAGAAAPLPERRRVLLGGAAVGLSMMAAGLAGCGGGGLDDDAALRAVNATAHLAQVDLLFNDWRFATAVGYGGQASAYARRPVWSVGAAGLFEAKQTGQTALLARKILALPEGDSGSVVLTGSQSTGLNMRILDENTPRPAGAHMRLRVLHGLPGHGALDVHITSANQPLAGRRPDLVVLSYQDLSTHATLSQGQRLRVTLAGRPDWVLFDNTATGFNNGMTGTLVIAPTAGAVAVTVTVLPQGEAAYRLASFAPTHS